MKFLILSLVVIIIQEQKTNYKGYCYKVVTDKGDTGTLFSGMKLKNGDTLRF